MNSKVINWEGLTATLLSVIMAALLAAGAVVHTGQPIYVVLVAVVWLLGRIVK